jgi:hypothetical protein
MGDADEYATRLIERSGNRIHDLAFEDLLPFFPMFPVSLEQP